jgi:integrase
VLKLAELVGRRYWALIVVAIFTGIRWGELVALRARDLNLDHGRCECPRRFAELTSRATSHQKEQQDRRRPTCLTAAAKARTQ